MKVTFVHNATVLIDTPDLTLLCDPWFTGGAYDGSWYQWPPIEHEPDRFDAVWLSHVHPDHYDPAWLAENLNGRPLLIGDLPSLKAAVERDGFTPTVISNIGYGNTELTVLPHKGWELDNIDSTLVVRHGKQTVVNVNDCPCDEQLVGDILAVAPEPSLALLPFAGAGPYPQTFIGTPEPIMDAARLRQRDAFLEQFVSWQQNLNPGVTLPFAGQYVLGGKNWRLDRHRGTPDPLCLSMLPNTFVLDHWGSLDLDDHSVEGARSAMLPRPVRHDGPMAWGHISERASREMLEQAALNATALVPPVPVTFQTDTLHVRVVDESLGTMILDDGLLYGLLTGQFHWDSALTGSNVRFVGSSQLVSKPFRDFYNRMRV